MRDRQAALEAKRQALLEAGVDMMDPSSVYVEDSVQVGEGTLLLPGTILRGEHRGGQELPDWAQRDAHQLHSGG